MIDENFSLMRAHRNNIARYPKLLKTDLTDLERQFPERRLARSDRPWRRLLLRPFLSRSGCRLHPQPWGARNAGGKVDRPCSERLRLGGPRRHREIDGAGYTSVTDGLQKYQAERALNEETHLKSGLSSNDIGSASSRRET
jgi:hypothetical protein